MTNKEYVLQNHADEILHEIAVYGLCDICKTIGCLEYCRSKNSPCTCKDTFEAWLNMEHTEPLLYPIGTIVETKLCNSKTYLGYYNGADNRGNHYICAYKENIGKMENNVPICTTRIHSNDVAKLIKKVGD